MRPREIQARIRAGESAEQVARVAGIHVERVRRFEGPVLAEREHMAQQAQRSSVRRPGQAELRPNTLAESLPSRLNEVGLTAGDLTWDSWRRDDGRWVVQASYSHDGLGQDATFLFDPRARSVVADNDQGRWLTGELEQHPARAPFVPRLATLAPPVPSTPEPMLELEDDDEFEDVDETPEAVVRRPDPTQNRREPDVVARRPEPVPVAKPAPPRPATVVAPPAPAPTVMPPMPTAAPPVAPAPIPAPVTTTTHTPVQAPAAEVRRVVETPTLPMEAAEEIPARRTGTHDASADEAPGATSAPKSGGRRGRARVPSWDDILIGTRPKD